MQKWTCALVCVLLSGCTGGSLANSGLPVGQQAYSTISPASTSQGKVDADYRIGALDSLSVSVFQEPDLSTQPNSPLQVNANGNIEMPLVGTIPAAGKTAAELSRFIEQRLGQNILQHPKVNVGVVESVSQRVTVQGEVLQPGQYDIKGKTTLLDALSMAKGESRVASLKQVAIFRVINGQRMGAIFDVEAIRRGQAADPQVLGSDVIVVGSSKGKSFLREFKESTGILGLFRPAGL